ncbi:hypothetical protein, partial [Pseudomonas viridiflava]|uniref:hypothetical protein n=1 Tax=Pseudomonas viridiflava TaxID=33069 RepID=UPI0019D29DC3
ADQRGKRHATTSILSGGRAECWMAHCKRSLLPGRPAANTGHRKSGRAAFRFSRDGASRYTFAGGEFAFVAFAAKDALTVKKYRWMNQVTTSCTPD